jgi:signal transduction histidine kinase
MKLLRGITNLLKNKNNHFCPTEPSAFFSSESASDLIDALNATTNAVGHSSIDTLAQKISETSNAEYIIIARLLENNKFSTISICHQNNILQNKNFEFEIDFSAIFANNNLSLILDKDTIFSRTILPKPKAKTVTSLLINDNNKTPIGIVLGLTRSRETKTISNILKFFSYNISTELRHLNNKENLEKKNRELLRTEEELKLKNQLLDNLNKNISKAKQVVDESSRLKSAFLANLSHEIRTPMNVIMGFTELLSADNMSLEQRINFIDIIQQNGTRLLHIMDSLIDISRFQARNVGKEQQAFSLNQMMQQLFNSFQAEIDNSGKPLSLIIEQKNKEGHDTVILDKEATYKILNHLLDNAVKFTASGFIKFGYEIRENQIVFYVEDTGIGVPEGKEKEIFDLFRQGDLRLSRQFGGTGLGLAIAKRYVNAMNGQIWCSNNEASEMGATFKFSLPLLSGKEKVNTLNQHRPKQLIESTTVAAISNRSMS